MTGQGTILRPILDEYMSSQHQYGILTLSFVQFKIYLNFEDIPPS